MEKIELVSYDFCPFIQPAIITLLEKNIPFKINYLKLGDKPDWFTDRVPSGQSPALLIGENSLIESSIINEYLNNVTPDDLHPKDPYIKAKNQVWIRFSYQILDAFYDIKVAETQDIYDKSKRNFVALMKKLENEVDGTRFFNGNTFCLIDTFYAPIFRSIQILDNHYGTEVMQQLPRLNNWSENLLSRYSVINSVPNSFENSSLERIKSTNSILNNHYR